MQNEEGAFISQINLILLDHQTLQNMQLVPMEGTALFNFSRENGFLYYGNDSNYNNFFCQKLYTGEYLQTAGLVDIVQVVNSIQIWCCF